MRAPVGVKNSDHAADLQVRSTCLDLGSSLLIPEGSGLPLGLGTPSIKTARVRHASSLPRAT